MSLLGSCDIAKKDLAVLAWLEFQREKESEREWAGNERERREKVRDGPTDGQRERERLR
jgi:hypothetical protein